MQLKVRLETVIKKLDPLSFFFKMWGRIQEIVRSDLKNIYYELIDCIELS